MIVRLMGHGRMVYPPEFTLSDEFNVDKGWEPIGTYHGRYSRWQEVEEKVQIPMQVESESLSATDDPESTTTSTSAATSPPPPPAQNGPPAAAAPSASSSSPPSSSPQPQWNTAHGRKGDTASPASSCYRRLGGHMPTATALNVYLPDNVPLSELQHETGGLSSAGKQCMATGWALVGRIDRCKKWQIHGSMGTCK